MHHHPASEQTADQHDSSGVSRRAFLRGSAVATVGAAGIGLGTGSAAAQWVGGDIPELDFRDGTPSVSTAPVDDEVVFNVHGYSGSSASVSQAEQFASTAEDLGYDGSVAAVTWDDAGLPSTAESNARETGGRLATYLEDYLDENPDTAVRVLGHSMGGFVTMEMTAGLSRHQVENADMIGSYEEVDAPCDGNFYDAIASNVSGMYNYHSSNDSIARLGQEGAQCGGGGWWGGGGGGDTPDNYADVDVSASVGSHFGYKSSEGCVQQILDNHEPLIDRGGGTDGGTDGGSDDDGGGWWS